MADEDPLDGADVGEQATVKDTAEHSLWDAVWGSDFHGRDRELIDAEVADARIEGEPGNERVVIEYEGEVMKTLPRGWDRAQNRESGREKSSQSASWLRAAVIVGGTLILYGGLVVLFVDSLLQGLSGTTINGEPIGSPPLVELIPTILLVFSLAGIIVWGLTGGLPGKVMRQ